MAKRLYCNMCDCAVEPNKPRTTVALFMSDYSNNLIGGLPADYFVDLTFHASISAESLELSTADFSAWITPVSSPFATAS